MSQNDKPVNHRSLLTPGPRVMFIEQQLDPIFRDHVFVTGDVTTMLPKLSDQAAVQGANMMSRQQVATWLSVSRRWVERHLRPSVQAARRGRAWYLSDDVEQQLAQLRVDEQPRSLRTKADPTPAQARARRAAATGTVPFEGVEHARAVATIERSLRESVERSSGKRASRNRGSRER